MPFTDPILGGNTLIRDAIQSQDYVPGTTGWAIKADGSAEFNNIVINGGGGVGRVVIDGGVIFIYDSVGNLVTKMDGTNGIQLSPNLNAAGSAVLTLDPGNPEISFMPATAGGITYAIGGILSSQNGSPNFLPFLRLFSPRNTATFDPQTFLQLSTGLISGAVLSSLDITTQQITLGGSRVWVLAHLDQLDCSGNLTLGGATALIPGCTVSYTGLPAGSTWEATLTVDSSIGATAGVTNVGEVWVQLNGGTLTKQTGDINDAIGVNTRAPFTRTWSGAFAAGGTLHIEAHGKFIGAGGVNAFFSPHTTLQVKVNE